MTQNRKHKNPASFTQVYIQVEMFLARTVTKGTVKSSPRVSGRRYRFQIKIYLIKYY